jgi:DNA-binding transcriptional regulator YiaG
MTYTVVNRGSTQNMTTDMTPERIRKIRVDNGWTLGDFAKLLGFATRGAVAHLESGRKKPTGPVLRLLRIAEQNPRIFSRQLF